MALLGFLFYEFYGGLILWVLGRPYLAFFGRRKASAGNQSQRSVCLAHPLGEPERRYVHSFTGRERRSCFSAAASVGPERSPLGTRTSCFPSFLSALRAGKTLGLRPNPHKLFEKSLIKNFYAPTASHLRPCPSLSCPATGKLLCRFAVALFTKGSCTTP